MIVSHRGCGKTFRANQGRARHEQFCEGEAVKRCSHDGCDRPLAHHGWCDYHVYRATNYGAPDALTNNERRWADSGLTREEACRLVITMTAEGRKLREIADSTGYSEGYISQLRWEARRGLMGNDLELALLIADQAHEMRHKDRAGPHRSRSLDADLTDDGGYSKYDALGVDSFGRAVDEASW